MRTIADRLAEMNARIDGDNLVLDPVNGSPRVVYTRLPGGAVLRDDEPVNATDMRHQLALDGPVAIWLAHANRAKPCRPLRADSTGRGDAVRSDRTDLRSIAPEYSYTPLDVGFDLRVQAMPVVLPAGERLRVRYMSDDFERMVEGTREHVAQALAAAGYMVAGEPCEGRR